MAVVPNRIARVARLGTSLRSRPLLCALLISAVLAAGFVLLLNPGYETNDDVGMQWVVDGTQGRPLPHLVFGNVLVGLVLRTLYRAVDWFPWYGLYLYLVHWAALLAVVYLVLADRRDRAWVRFTALGGILALFHLSMWMELQFTSAALLLGTSGLVLYAATSRDPARPRAVFAAGLMVGFAPLVRWDALPATAVLALPVLVLTVRRVPWRLQALFAGTAAVVILAGWLGQALYYGGDDDWTAYSDFNHARGRLHQAPGLKSLDPELLAEVGWSENDLKMFDSWFFTDEAVYQLEDLQAISDALPPTFRWRTALRSLLLQADGLREAARLALVAALGALVWVEGDRRERGLAVLATATCGALAFALSSLAKLPGRVMVPILAFLALLFLTRPPARGPAAGAAPARGARPLRAIVAVVSVVAMLVGADAALDLDRRHHRADAGLRQVLAELEAIDPDGVFVAWGAQLPLGGQSLSPWRRGGLGGPYLLSLGWQERSPMHEAWMAEHGITDLYAAIATRRDVYLPLRQPELGGTYLSYLQEHYSVKGMMLRPVGRAGRLTVYNLVTAYEIDDQARILVERTLDGSAVEYPLATPGISGYAIVVPAPRNRLAVTGSAADAKGPADLIVLTSKGRGIALALPAGNALGASQAWLPDFWFSVRSSRQDLRVFAISDGFATELGTPSPPLP